MSGDELTLLIVGLLAAAVGAVATALVARRGGATPSQPTKPDTGEPQKEQSEHEQAAQPAGTDWRSKLFAEWSGLLTAVGTIAVAVGTYQLAKDIGKGELSGTDQVEVVIATACFALGIGLLVTIPVSLRTRNRVMFADAVRSQQRWNTYRRWRLINWFGWHRVVVPPSSLFGFDDIVDFERQNTELIKEARVWWERDQEPPPELVARLEHFRTQRREIEQAVATTRLRSASRRAVLKAGFGMVLAVGGFVDATYVTNQGVRQAEVADGTTANDRAVAQAAVAQANKIADATLAHQNAVEVADSTRQHELDKLELTHEQELQKLVLNDALAEAGTPGVLPATGSDVSVTFPDAETAATILDPTGASLPEACTTARAGNALDIGDPPDGTAAERIVFVAFPRTAECNGAAGWVDPAWLGAPTAADGTDGTDTIDDDNG